jgi:hypothetical protein
MDRIIRPFAAAFTRPSFARFTLLLVGCIITFGRRTVSRILWALGPAVYGHSSSYHRFFSKARWSLWPLARVLATLVLELLGDDLPVRLAVDDTVLGHGGRRVYAKGCHRDAVRSSVDPRHKVNKWGHKWVVLAVLVPLPFTTRTWALPVLCALYRPRNLNQKEGRRHKTPCELARGLVAVMLHWFPDRQFILLGDGGFASHDLACFAHRHRDRLSFVFRARKDMNLHALHSKPPCRQTLYRWRKAGRTCGPRCRKGAKLPSPAQSVAAARAALPEGGRLPTAGVCWYGQSQRELEMLSGCGGWYRGVDKRRAALIPLRWVYTRDTVSGKEDCFACTDCAWSPKRMVEEFAGRWSMEVTFQEGRAHLGWETTRQRCAASVLRATPCLMGLFSLISVLWAKLWHERRCDPVPANDKPKDQGQKNKPVRQPQGKQAQGKPLCVVHQTPCYVKDEMTFADALAGVRRLLWDGCMLRHVLGPRRVAKLPKPVMRMLTTYLARAA